MLQPNQLSPLDTEKPYLRAANISWSGVDTSDVRSMWFTPSDKLKYRLNPGDLLVSEGGDVGRSAIWDGAIEECYFQNAINRIRKRDGGDTRFLYYWMYFLKHIGFVDLICNKSTIAHYTAEKVQDSPCICPSQDEQTAIANFLDRETAKIDTLIDKQEQLIKLLEEKRQAVISHAVTKGLNPDVRMKDSGVEWLGEVPEHWQVSKASRYVEFSTSGSRGWSDYISDEGDIFVQSGALTDRMTVDLEHAPRIHPPQNQEAARTQLRKGDVLVVITGAKTGKVAIMPASPVPAYVNQHVCLIRVRQNEVLPQYLASVLWSDVGQFYFGAAQYGLKLGLGLDDVSSIHIPIPPANEQCAIMEHIGNECRGIVRPVELAQQGIKLLAERRTALISAAVTGKIDVRNAVSAQEPPP